MSQASSAERLLGFRRRQERNTENLSVPSVLASLCASVSFLFLFAASFLCLSRPQNRQPPPPAPRFADSHSIYSQK